MVEMEGSKLSYFKQENISETRDASIQKSTEICTTVWSRDMGFKEESLLERMRMRMVRWTTGTLLLKALKNALKIYDVRGQLVEVIKTSYRDRSKCMCE